jgi:hypothetical protein
MKLFYFSLFYTLSCFCFSQSISGVINQYYEATAINMPANSITLANTTGLSTDDRVLIIQMKGASYNNSNTASYGDITAMNSAGLYEFNNICSISGNDIVLKYTLLNSYNAGGMNRLQIIKVPQYTNPTVIDNLTCQPWNGITGGVLVLEATGTLTLNDTITVRSMGFTGGIFYDFAHPPLGSFNCPAGLSYLGYVTNRPPSGNDHGAMKGEGIADTTTAGRYARGKQINGGGGGNNHNAGGAGGGNYAAGGIGGQRTVTGFFPCYGAAPGVAGIALSTYGYSATNNRIFLGGGGGAGHGNNNQGTSGGDGGGIVIIRANAIDGNGFPIIADGRNFYPAATYAEGTPGALSDGGGGGGAGGVIILDVSSVISATNTSVRGGNGSNASWGDNNCFGPGGGGGGGAIWISAAATYPLLSTNVTGGANGVRGPSSSYPGCNGTTGGAMPGGNGSVLYNYVAPINSIEFCVTSLPVAQNVLKGRNEQGEVLLTWQNPDKIYTHFIVERSQNGGFTPITTVLSHQTLQITDKNPYQGKNMYRLQMVNKDGKIRYSNIVEIYTQYTSLTSNVYPNPSWQDFAVECYTQNEKPIQIYVFDVLGKNIHNTQVNTVNVGKNIWNISAQSWEKGVYYLHIVQGTERMIHKIVKL